MTTETEEKDESSMKRKGVSKEAAEMQQVMVKDAWLSFAQREDAGDKAKSSGSGSAHVQVISHLCDAACVS